MKQMPVKLGPMALLLTVISILLTVLAILNFSSARADLALARAYGRTVQERYDLEAKGHTFLRDADQALREGKDLSDLPGVRTEADGSVWYELTEDAYTLTVGVNAREEAREEAQAARVLAFSVQKGWEEEMEIGGLWNGFALPGGGSAGG